VTQIRDEQNVHKNVDSDGEAEKHEQVGIKQSEQRRLAQKQVEGHGETLQAERDHNHQRHALGDEDVAAQLVLAQGVVGVRLHSQGFEL